jgi:hypothetical protein
LIISQIQRLPAFNFKNWKNGGAVALVTGERDLTLAQVDLKFAQLRRLVLCSLERYETEIPAVRKLALRFLGQAIARYSPNYFCWLQTVVKLSGIMVLAPPTRTDDVWLEISSGRPSKAKYRVMLWPEIVVFVPKTKRTFHPSDVSQVETSIARLLDERAETRGIRQRYLLMGAALGEEWWRDCSPRVVSYGTEIAAIEVCAQITAQVGANKESRDLAGWYLRTVPAVQRWGNRAYAKAARSLHIEDIYQLLREIG